jgi:hypothetical protein
MASDNYYLLVLETCLLILFTYLSAVHYCSRGTSGLSKCLTESLPTNVSSASFSLDPFCLFYLKTTSFLADSINNVEVSLEESDSESTDPLDPAVSVKVISPIKNVPDIAGLEKSC